MTDKEKLEAIRAEIHRLVHVNGYSKEMANELFSYMNSLPNEPVSEDLEEAADNYASAYKQVGYDEDHISSVCDAFIDGANWQKEQMMKDVVEIPLHQWLPALLYDKMSEKGFKDGDKVKLIIIKKD